MVHQCLDCHKIYKSRQSLWNHEHKFHITDEEKIIELQKKNKKMKELLKNNNKKIINQTVTNNQTVNNNQTIINNNTINNITIKFGDEDVAKLSTAEVNQILSSRDALIKLVEIVHVNQKYREYNNVRVTNLKDKFCKTFDGTKFISQNRKDVINALITNRNSDLETLHQQYSDETKRKHRIIKELIDKIDKCLDNERNNDNDKELTKYYKSVCEEITLILFNQTEI